MCDIKSKLKTLYHSFLIEKEILRLCFMEFWEFIKYDPLEPNHKNATLYDTPTSKNKVSRDLTKNIGECADKKSVRLC